MPIIAVAVEDTGGSEVAPARAALSSTEPTPPASLKTDLAVLCPERSAPAYPSQARHQREQGEVTLRVELDERGRIESVNVLTSSGSRRLDEAARAAIQSWRCNPAQRDGQSVRAVALQSLAFVLERR